MPKRTVRSARQAFEDAAPSLNPTVHAQYVAELQAAEAAALQRATRFIDDRFTEAKDTGNATVKEVCSVRDRAAALLAETKAGRITAREANDSLIALRNEFRLHERSAATLTQTAEMIASIEDAPVEWFDTFATTYPMMQPDFSF